MCERIEFACALSRICSTETISLDKLSTTLSITLTRLPPNQIKAPSLSLRDGELSFTSIALETFAALF